jgi:hypothetical protein
MVVRDLLRDRLRQQRIWLEFQETRREGWRRAWRRVRLQRRILATPPTRTDQAGPVEVRVLTWRRDWVNMIWALKSFYYFSVASYPLYIHDGGLTRTQVEQLQKHFPDAVFIPADAADAHIGRELQRGGFARALAYRQRNVSTRKLFDFYVFSSADYIISIDSDIVFFRSPEKLLVPASGIPKNLYNKDIDYWYSLSLDEMESSFGIRPPPLINSGLNVVRRESIDIASIDRWLAHPKLFDDTWVAEQTLHALCSTVHGVELLPDTYCVSRSPGLSPDMICKHYPGFFRHLLYEEGMRHLIDTGFLNALQQSPQK